jgi:GDP-mannose 4,6-dehydratase
MDFGHHCLSGRFPNELEPNPPSEALALVKCDDVANTQNCGLVQLKHTVSPDELYMQQSYGYRSGLNKTMTSHLGELVQEVCSRLVLLKNDFVLDIGSNDATLLKSYDKRTPLTKVGVDPGAAQFAQYYDQECKLICGFFSAEIFRKAYGFSPKVRIITSISMFYDLPDPLAFAKDVQQLLAPDGVWVSEQSYIVTMLQSNSMDTICHEHLEYYALKQFDFIAEQAGLKIVDASLNACNGGSIRLTFAQKYNTAVKTNQLGIDAIRKLESSMQLNTLQPYANFERNCGLVKRNLVTFITSQRLIGKTIYLYGASTKGNTLLQYCGLDNSVIRAAAERNPDKYGRRTPKTNIPIISEAEMRLANPDFLLVLPWHFKSEFLEREQSYLNQGGQFIFPLPNVSIVSGRKKAFVTGITGQIGHYLQQILVENNYHVYGTTRHLTTVPPGVHLLQLDLQDNEHQLEPFLEMLVPDEVYNLAAETDAVESLSKPLETISINGVFVTRLCEIIHRLQLKHKKVVKLFQANSAELFKGSGNVMLNESNTDFHPKNPYGLGKLLAYWTIRYYRESFGLHFSNGIIFTTESPYRNPKFVIRKITQKIAQIRDGKTTDLGLGQLDSCRDWIHAYDVANAAFQILQQSLPNEYIISLGELHMLREVIEQCFGKIGVELEWTKEQAVDKNTGFVYVRVDPNFFRTYEAPSQKLLGDNTRLKSIGWAPKFTFGDILDDMLRAETF